MNDKSNKKIFCVIPAFNEEKTISKVLKDVGQYADTIIVVDDNSSDNTCKFALREGAIVLRHIVNRGQGAALQTGNEYAIARRADVIVHFDADGQFNAKEIKDITKPIVEENYDVVFGSRYLGKKSNIPWFKDKVIFPIARIVNKIFFNINLTDPQSGFRALSRRATKKIIITQDGMAHCSEIMQKAFKNNLKIKEVSIAVVYNHFGQKASGGVKILKDLVISKLIN